jgi:AraC family transcriptional regulator, regulatory protein of adaptative response / DNA-3-methyladenine glycosylase II
MANFHFQQAYDLRMNTISDDTTDALASLACYQALKAHDARFDGRFFVAVSSTRIYCRPVCRVKLPKFENCRFFDHAAQAESHGYRPCMRCRPELAPRNLPWTTQDASSTLALQAARWLDEPSAWQGDNPSISQLAKHLGVSDRHVRRIFEAHFGVSPLQYLQTRRLLTAKQLLTDTDLAISHIAIASGFGSVRRFSDAFLTHYRLNPSQLRKTAHSSENRTDSGADTRTESSTSTSQKYASYCSVKLSYRPPYDSQWMLDFFRKRQLNNTEFIAIDTNNTPARWTFNLKTGGKVYAGWISVYFLSNQPTVLLKVSDSLRDVLPQVIRQVRALLDLDADPMAINAVLKNSFESPNVDFSGLRVPGCLNGFELAVRAILGQQVTVAAGRTFAQRVVDAFGMPIETPFPGLTRLFPTPETLAAASGEALGQLGIVKQRQAAIVALAKAVASKELYLHPGVAIEETMAKLRDLPGVGDWTAQYIAMRALRWPDAFVAGDVALHKAMGLQHQSPPLSPVKTAAAALEASQAWRPWRSYAVMRAWTSLSKLA